MTFAAQPDLFPGEPTDLGVLGTVINEFVVAAYVTRDQFIVARGCAELIELYAERLEIRRTYLDEGDGLYFLANDAECTIWSRCAMLDSLDPEIQARSAIVWEKAIRRRLGIAATEEAPR